MKSHHNLVKIVLILFITFFTPIIDENSLRASDLFKKNLGMATWANDTTLSGWRNSLRQNVPSITIRKYWLPKR